MLCSALFSGTCHLPHVILACPMGNIRGDLALAPKMLVSRLSLSCSLRQGPGTRPISPLEFMREFSKYLFECMPIPNSRFDELLRRSRSIPKNLSDQDSSDLKGVRRVTTSELHLPEHLDVVSDPMWSFPAQSRAPERVLWQRCGPHLCIEPFQWGNPEDQGSGRSGTLSLTSLSET